MSETQSLKKMHGRGSVMITGGSGLIGRYVTSSLLSEGYKVCHLSRSANQFGKVRVFRWDPEKGILDPSALEGVDCVIHLAGANIGEKRWTLGRKEEISNSRIESAKLLLSVIKKNKIKLNTFISASAVGYYGSITSENIFREEDPPADDFLGSVCGQWENAADLFVETGARVVKIRTGVVMEKSDSALSKLLKPAAMGVFPRLGTGKQYMPWIHIEDLCNIYVKTIQDKTMKGAYNAVAPQHITQLEFMRSLAISLNKSFFHPPVPSVLLKLAMGEMSDVVLKGSRISYEKILNSGFRFHYPELKEALEDILATE